MVAPVLIKHQAVLLVSCVRQSKGQKCCVTYSVVWRQVVYVIRRSPGIRVVEGGSAIVVGAWYDFRVSEQTLLRRRELERFCCLTKVRALVVGARSCDCLFGGTRMSLEAHV